MVILTLLALQSPYNMNTHSHAQQESMQSQRSSIQFTAAWLQAFNTLRPGSVPTPCGKTALWIWVSKHVEVRSRGA